MMQGPLLADPGELFCRAFDTIGYGLIRQKMMEVCKIVVGYFHQF
jgi:hypothetical protein